MTKPRAVRSQGCLQNSGPLLSGHVPSLGIQEGSEHLLCVQGKVPEQAGGTSPHSDLLLLSGVEEGDLC